MNDYYDDEEKKNSDDVMMHETHINLKIKEIMYNFAMIIIIII